MLSGADRRGQELALPPGRVGALRRALRRLVLAPVRFYQRYLSGLKPTPTCRFAPSCSQYAVEAIERRGVIAGSAAALWRILRCNPLCPGGHDPVEPVERPGARDV